MSASLKRDASVGLLKVGAVHDSVAGVLPLALGSGAGAAGRIAIGTAVLGGTIISTLLGLLFVPLFFVWVRGWVARRKTV